MNQGSGTATLGGTRMRRGIPHDSVRLFCGNPRIIYRAELVLVEESLKNKFERPGGCRETAPGAPLCFATEPGFSKFYALK
ncbi:hypothetical protein J6590_104937 [Homalodisca vitripennis]|nr:hypothetical protein J6590_104937 [Homalodisca vitripennis]